MVKLIKKRYSKKNIYFKNNQKINISVRPNSIKRCINNLLSNSLKFSKNIEITCSRKNNYVEIIIDDDGPGIPKKERSKVLQPFYRVESSRNRGTGGIGLGITIATDIINNHGGNFFFREISSWWIKNKNLSSYIRIFTIKDSLWSKIAITFSLSFEFSLNHS